MHVELAGTDVKTRLKTAGHALTVLLPDGYRPKVDYAAALKVNVA
jgi:hypothetical protein